MTDPAPRPVAPLAAGTVPRRRVHRDRHARRPDASELRRRIGGRSAGEEVLVLDFGGQYSQLIARRIRECGVFAELLPHDTELERIRERAPGGAGAVGRARLGLLGGRPGAARRAARARGPGAGHLLRDAGDGAGARRPGRGRRGGRVRPHAAGPGRRRRAAAVRAAARAAVLDEPPRRGVRASARLRGPRLQPRLAGGRASRAPTAASTASSSTPRSSTRRTAPRSSTASCARSPASSSAGRPASVIERAGRAGPGPGGRRRGDLRPLRRRRLGRPPRRWSTARWGTSSPACSSTTA